ncbi:MAG: SPOR domain-containing protein [Lysobacter sp.]
MFARALFVLLLVVNVGVAVWWATRAPPSSPSPTELPLGIARLQRVAETPGMTVPSPIPPLAAAQPGPATSPAPPVEVPATKPQCLSFGPYLDDLAVVAAQAQLQPLAQRVVVREQPRGDARGWRVMLPALPDEAQAEATAERIAAAGFSDYFVVREGSETNAIALGRYSNETAARRRAEALVAAGFAARTEPLGNPVKWLDVRAAPGFDASAAQQLAAAPERRVLDCAALQ